MQEKTTDEVEKILEGLKPEGLGNFYRDNSRSMADDKKAFYYYMKDIAESKNIRLMDMYSFAGVSESYGSKIITMEKHTKSRDLIIRLCIAGHFSLTEINKALKLYGMNPLYSKSKRDAVLIVAVNNRIYSISDIDDMLFKHGFDQLSSE